jgi:hypothetical protein
LELQKKLIVGKPFIIGKALIIPKNMVDSPEFSEADARSKKIIEQLAIDIVMKEERRLDRHPVDVSPYNYGWDIESYCEGKNTRLIEAGKNIIEKDPDNYLLAIVWVDGDRASGPAYIRSPYDGVETNYATTSMTFNIRKLLTKEM